MEKKNPIARHLDVRIREPGGITALSIELALNLTPQFENGSQDYTYDLTNLDGNVNAVGLEGVRVQSRQDDDGKFRLLIHRKFNSYFVTDGSKEIIKEESPEDRAFDKKDRLTDAQVWQVVHLVDEVLSDIVRPAIGQFKE